MMRGVLVAVLVLGAAAWGPPAAAAAVAEHPGASCRAVDVPVTLPLIGAAAIYGELCVPDGGARTVQLLVHGGSYDHHYFDWRQDPDRYSYARRALAAGYATFAVDRLGSGRSTHPLSALASFEQGAEALHQVIGKLRAGAVGGDAFSRVVWVGHSMGSLTAWYEATRNRDVDAFVLTGLLHNLRPTFAARLATSLYPVALDPKFAGAGLDPGYVTTRPGTRDDLFYATPAADTAVIAEDERLKQTISAAEAAAIPTDYLPPLLAASRTLRVPTLLVMGERDGVWCGPDGYTCTPEAILAAEAPYYHASARLQVIVAEDSGHNIALHHGAPQAAAATLAWIDALD